MNQIVAIKVKTVEVQILLSRRCGFCYPDEQGKHGEVAREWSQEMMMFIPVCRKHTLEDPERCEAEWSSRSRERGNRKSKQ